MLLKNLFLFPEPDEAPEPAPEDPTPEILPQPLTQSVSGLPASQSISKSASIPSSSRSTSTHSDIQTRNMDSNLQLTLLQRFKFIWRGGIASYRREARLCELLQPDESDPSTSVELGGRAVYK